MYNKRRRALIYVMATLVICYCMVLCSMTLYVHDDLDWGGPGGLRLLRSGFQGYNGRYLGNILVLGMTRNALFKTAFMGLCLAAIVLLPAVVFPQGIRLNAMLAAACLIGAIPTNIARQTIGWVSGFANYGTSSVLILLFLLYALPRVDGGTPLMVRRTWIPAMALLGLCGSLLMENVTIFFCTVPLATWVYTLRRRAPAHGLVACALGAWAGAMIMFTNPVYLSIAQGTDGYRQIGGAARSPIAFLASCWRTFRGDIIYPFLLDCIPLLLAFSLVLLAIMVRNRDGKHTLVSRFACAARWYCILFPMLPIVQKLHPNYAPLRAYTRDLFAAMCVIYALCLGVALLYGAHGPVLRRRTLLYGCVFALVAPLCTVSPVGGRCFLPSYVVMCLLLLHAAVDVLSFNVNEDITGVSPAPLCLPGARMALMGLACFYAALWLHVSYYNQRTQQERLAYLHAQVSAGAQAAVVTELPYPGYVWFASPYTEDEATLFKSFYDLPEHLELTVIPYEQWYTMRHSQ